MMTSMQRAAFLFVLVAFSPTLFAQTKKKKPIDITSDIILKANLKQHIAALSNFLLQEDGTEIIDENKAVAYLALQYKKMALQPLGDSSTFIQVYQKDKGLEIKPSSFLRINGIPLKTGADYWPFPFCPPVHFFGTATWGGATAGEPFLYDLKDTLLANKQITRFNLINSIYGKAMEMALKKATALLVFNSSETSDSLAFLPTDTTVTAPIPVIYITRSGIEKMERESKIANALEGNCAVGKKIDNGYNMLAYLNNAAANTVIVCSHVSSGAPATAAVLELAKALSGFAAAAKKKGTVADTFRVRNNNYCFINWGGENEGADGPNYLIQHSLSQLSHINYVVDIDCENTTSHVAPLVIGGTGSSPMWDIKTMDSSITAKPLDNPTPQQISVRSLNAPTLFFLADKTNGDHKYDTATENSTMLVNYLLQLIRRLNEKGKLTFTP